MRLFITFLLCLIGVFAHAADQENLFGLKGDVDSICTITDDSGYAWQIEVVFDEDGNLLEVDGCEVVCKRDASGRLTEYTAEDEDELGNTITIVTTLSYNKRNRVAKTRYTSGSDTWTETYTYDPAGLLVKKEFSGPEENEIYTYKYIKTDKQGNWTERIETGTLSEVAVRQIRNITYVE